MGPRVGLNAAFYDQPHTGSGQYLRHLLEGLRVTRGDLRCRLLGATGKPAWLPGKNLSKVYLEQVGVPLAGGAVDLLHYPYFAAPLLSPRPVVVTVHDLIPILLPRYRGGWTARLYTALAAAATRRARLIICDSEHSRGDCLRLLNVPRERTRVVYLAAAPDLGPADPETAAAVARRHGLEGRFLLYFGGLDHRKNLGTLLRGFADFARGREDALLAVAGRAQGTGPLFPDWPALARALGLERQVRFLGHVPEEEKAALYTAAWGFVFPSAYEGFGLPPLEAMACGTPVVCADASSLPEVVGDAALLAPADSPSAWTAALARLWDDAEPRGELAARGRARAHLFTWEKTARETAEVYECALS